MAKSRNKKGHKARSRNRTLRIKQIQKSAEKKHREMIMKLIEDQKKKEMFTSLPDLNQEPQINLDGPVI